MTENQEGNMEVEAGGKQEKWGAAGGTGNTPMRAKQKKTEEELSEMRKVLQMFGELSASPSKSLETWVNKLWSTHPRPSP